MVEKYFLYGTLMSGYYNHHMLYNCTKFIRETELEGVELYDFGAYPAAVISKDSKIKGQLYEITDKTKFQKVIDMELMAGYNLSAVIVDGEMCYCFIYMKKLPMYAKPYGKERWVKDFLYVES